MSGLTLATTRDQLITATLQAVAFQSHELIAAMASDGAVVDNLRVDGGMVVNDWLCQCLADVVNLPVERPEITETTALPQSEATNGVPTVQSVGSWFNFQTLGAPTMSSTCSTKIPSSSGLA